MSGFFSGRTVWIIGAGSGIGRALAVELNRRDAKLILSSRDMNALNSLNSELGGGHVVSPVDITHTDLVSGTWKNHGPIDSVIVIAGDYQPMDLNALDMKRCRAIIETNLIGALNVVHAVLPDMLARRFGQIALCASVAGYRGLPHGQPYSATKAGLINLAESLKAETKGCGIDIRLINPGFVRTAMTAKNRFHMPMMIEPDEAARAIAEGLQGRRFEVHFPRRFTWVMKILRCLPAWFYFKVMPK